MKIDKCRVCSSKSLESFICLGNQPHGDSYLSKDSENVDEPLYPLSAVFCNECSTVQLDYTVPKEVMFLNYLYVSGTTKTLSKHFGDSTDFLIQKYGLKENDFVLDIGSNDGTWLSFFKHRRLKVLGVDPARNLASLAVSRGIDTLSEFFTLDLAHQIKQRRGTPQLITAAGVFFHLEELHSVTSGVSHLIDETGVFCIQAIYLPDMISGNKFDQIYHEHLTYWTLTSLSRLLEIHNLKPFFVRKLDIHGGSIEVHVSKPGVRPVHYSVTTMLEMERDQGFTQLLRYILFSKTVEQIGQQLKEILNSYRAVNKPVYGLGAPIKGATLLNTFGIGTDLLQAVVEVNDFKIGRLMPGSRIPIIMEDLNLTPAAYLVLAWNFIDEIIIKYESYLKGGGELILPFPYPRILTARGERTI